MSPFSTRRDKAKPIARHEACNWSRSSSNPVRRRSVIAAPIQRMIEVKTSKPAPFDDVAVHSFSRFLRDHIKLEFYVRKLAKNGVKLASITQEMGDDPMHVMMRQIMALFQAEPAPLTEDKLNGVKVAVEFLGWSHRAWWRTLQVGRFAVNDVPGVSVSAVERLSDRQARLTLAYDDTDFDPRPLRGEVRRAAQRALVGTGWPHGR